MKHALSFFAGAALISAAVIWGGGKPAAMFVAGAVFAAIAIACATRIVGFNRVGRFLLAFDRAYAGLAAPAASQSSRDERPAPSSRVATPGRHRKETTRGANVVSFQKTDVLNTTQQEVISALCNLGMPMPRAQKIVLEASEGKPGIDFDSLFRACQSNPRKATA